MIIDSFLDNRLFSLVPLTAYDVVFSIGVSLAIILCGMLLFHFWWIKSTEFYFPRGSRLHDTGKYIRERKSEQVEDRIKTEGFWEFLGTLGKILSDLDPEYWTAYAGFDGRSR